MDNKNNKIKLVEARRLKGFPDFAAQDVMLREYVIGKFKTTFEKYGYEPLETPALELTEMMTGISGAEAEKMFYRFQDPGNRDVMLKYEVMTAMCRYVAENIGKINFPYKRYQIQKVWRAENVQKGRYREFTQCDADTVGSKSVFYDAEFIQMGLEIVKSLGFKDYVARISNRKFLEGLSEYVGVCKDQFYPFFVSIDKLLKIGKEGVISEMVAKGIEKDKAEKTLEIIDTEKYAQMSFDQLIEKMRETVGTTQKGKESLDELADVNKYLQMFNLPTENYIFDLSLARGLASYTGPVWEFEIKEGGVGSIAGCGRYDNVIGRYVGRDVPATGGSFGIERVCDILTDRKMIDLGQTTTEVMVTTFNDELLAKSYNLAMELRNVGIKALLYPEAIGLGKQLQYADRKKIKYAVILGPDEVEKGVVQLKDLSKGESKTLSQQELVDTLKK